jgi:hypothetical protein
MARRMAPGAAGAHRRRPHRPRLKRGRQWWWDEPNRQPPPHPGPETRRLGTHPRPDAPHPAWTDPPGCFASQRVLEAARNQAGALRLGRAKRAKAMGRRIGPRPGGGVKGGHRGAGRKARRPARPTPPLRRRSGCSGAAAWRPRSAPLGLPPPGLGWARRAQATAARSVAAAKAASWRPRGLTLGAPATHQRVPGGVRARRRQGWGQAGPADARPTPALGLTGTARRPHRARQAGRPASQCALRTCVGRRAASGGGCDCSASGCRRSLSGATSTQPRSAASCSRSRSWVT